MPYPVTVFSILVAGPSDVDEERREAVAAIEEWNRLHSRSRGTVMRAVGWEDVRPELGDDPQAIINHRLADQCEAIIAIFNVRVGTKTPRAISGTAEEIERLRLKGKHVMLYFSDGLMDRDVFSTRQFTELEKFRRKMQKMGILGRFSSVADLRQKLPSHLVQLGYDFEDQLRNQASSIQEQGNDQSTNGPIVPTQYPSGLNIATSQNVPEWLPVPNRSTAIRFGAGTAASPLQPDGEGVLLVAARVALRANDLSMSTLDFPTDSDTAPRTRTEMKRSLDELVRRGLVTIRLDQGDVGVHLRLTPAGLDYALPILIPNFDELVNRIRRIICGVKETTSDEIAFDGISRHVIEHVALDFERQGLVRTRRYADEMKIDSPSPELCP